MRNRNLLVAASGALGAAAIVGYCSCKSEAPAPTPAPAPAPEAAKPAEPAPAPAPAPEGKGTIHGTVKLAGTAPAREKIKRDADPICAKTEKESEEVIANADGTLRNVIAYVPNVPGSYPAPSDKVEIDQSECTYVPHALGLVGGQTLVIKNSDQTMHNVHTYKGDKTLFNKAQPPGLPPIEQVIQNGDAHVVKFKCDVHPWMSAHLLVSSNPFFAVTGEDGSFHIADVPAGAHKLTLWHEKYGSQELDVTVEKDGTATVEATFTAN